MKDCRTCPFREKGLFKRLSDRGMTSLQNAFSTSQYRARQVVFHQGSPVEAFYFLCEGAVKLVRDSPQGKQTIVALVGPCGRFGELSFAEGAVQSVTAEVVGGAVVRSVSRGAMVEVLRQDPTLSPAMLEELNTSLADARAHWADFAHQPVRLRVLHLLAALFDRYGRQVNGHWDLGVPLGRAEIAEMLGTATETAIRSLAQLQREGYLKLGRRSISVTDPKVLRSLSEGEALGFEERGVLKGSVPRGRGEENRGRKNLGRC